MMRFETICLKIREKMELRICHATCIVNTKFDDRTWMSIQTHIYTYMFVSEKEINFLFVVRNCIGQIESVLIGISIRNSTLLIIRNDD